MGLRFSIIKPTLNSNRDVIKQDFEYSIKKTYAAFNNLVSINDENDQSIRLYLLIMFIIN